MAATPALLSAKTPDDQMVFQDPDGSLHPRHTVETLLEEPLLIHRIEQRDRRINALLEQVGLGPQFRRRCPHQLSGGQRQRVAIARADSRAARTAAG